MFATDFFLITCLLVYRSGTGFSSSYEQNISDTAAISKSFVVLLRSPSISAFMLFSDT